MVTRRWFNISLAGALIAAVSPEWGNAMPANAKWKIDTHAHIFTQGLKLAPVHRYLPDYDAPLETYLSLLRKFSFTNGVLIQPSFLGTDNSYLMAALKAHPNLLRGIAVIDPTRDAEKLEEMSEEGCVGIRLNLFGFPDPELTAPAWKRVLAKIRNLDWQVEIHAEARRLPEIINPLLDAGVKVAVDHFGRPSSKLGVDDPGFQYLLSAAESRRVWIAISGAYRNGAGGRGEQIALEAIPMLKKSFGLDRMIWGSDWPFTQFEKSENYETAYQFLLKMLPAEQERRVVLGDTPAKLFKFI